MAILPAVPSPDTRVFGLLKVDPGGADLASSRGMAERDANGLHGVAVALLLCVGCSGEIADSGAGSPDAPTPMDQPVDIEGPDVLPHVQAFANAACGTLGACQPSTYVGHSPSAERAVDILVSDVYGEVPPDDNALGDALAELALARQAEFGITYVIWRQRINFGSGWDPMEDRGSITQNHYDHVHTSFEQSP